MMQKPQNDGENDMNKFIGRLWRDQSGQDLAEYSLLVALIAIACIGAVTAFGAGTQGGLQGAANGFIAGIGGP